MKRFLTASSSALFFLACQALADNTDTEAQKIQALQLKAEHALAGRTGSEAYAPVKARAFLDLALDELYEDDQTGIVQAAMAEADKLLANPELALPFSMPAKPLLPGSEAIREDLWNRIAAMHASPDFGCAARQLGQLEVLLNWAGHEKWESGWSHAKPYVEQVENQTYDAEMAIRQCESQSMASSKPAEKSAPTPMVTIEHYTFSTDALFKFNKDGVEHLVAGGEQKLRALTNSLRKWKSIEKIEIIGHTDRLGSDSYNDELSGRRAKHVRDYLVERGLSADVILANGHGKSEPLVHCNGMKKTTRLISCLQPNRRVDITVTGIRE